MFEISSVQQMFYECILPLIKLMCFWTPSFDLCMRSLKTAQYPGWKIMAWSWRNMVMIMPWWWHGDQAFWHGRHDLWQDHGMIIMYSMLLMKKMDCLSLFSQIDAAIYHLPNGTLDWFKRNLRLQSIGKSQSAKLNEGYSKKQSFLR